jgi:hypothetical protein
MTLDELRKLREAMVQAELSWVSTVPNDKDEFLAYRLATNVYEVAAVEYVDSLLNAMTPEVK